MLSYVGGSAVNKCSFIVVVTVLWQKQVLMPLMMQMPSDSGSSVKNMLDWNQNPSSKHAWNMIHSAHFPWGGKWHVYCVLFILSWWCKVTGSCYCTSLNVAGSTCSSCILSLTRHWGKMQNEHVEVRPLVLYIDSSLNQAEWAFKCGSVRTLHITFFVLESEFFFQLPVEL